MEAHFWKGCAQIDIDPEIVHGEPVFKGTRLPVEAALESYYAYRELVGMSHEEAINATLDSFPTIPGGAGGLRVVLAYETSRERQFA